MNVVDLLRSLGDHLAGSATVNDVFGQPVSAGERTVIPIARISYSFGGGGGSRADQSAGDGGGGGGGISARPCGALEISPDGARGSFGSSTLVL